MPSVTVTVTGANEFSPELIFDAATPGEFNKFNVRVSGTFVATVTVQQAFPEDLTTFFDVKQYTGPIVELGDSPEPGTRWKIGVKSGDFTSGTLNLRLGF